MDMAGPVNEANAERPNGQHQQHLWKCSHPMDMEGPVNEAT
eukprot:CAMPEP_0185019884 /NCGR_PEP_ID=MMETSP1103-20130426/2469_1 /TAXON_ID=36769 /ORGANISM="Paraphysomonas bandaiensis, Strain Caron Lab Isolate" /LENGTH=40 /DNA_ID= /DNA_START= /DNA_END= /DNA_ORIENTATION=